MSLDHYDADAVASRWGRVRPLPRDPGAVNVVALSGDLTRPAAPALRTELIDALGGGGPRLVLDLGSVRSCDSYGVHAIELAAGRAMRRGGALRVAHVPPHLTERFESAVGLAVYPSVSDALSAPWRLASGLSTAR